VTRFVTDTVSVVPLRLIWVETGGALGDSRDVL